MINENDIAPAILSAAEIYIKLEDYDNGLANIAINSFLDKHPDGKVYIFNHSGEIRKFK